MTTVLIIIVAAIALLLVVAALQPAAFRVERTAVVNAPPDRVYPLINDLRGFNSWNPFLKMEPEAAVVYSGPAQGKGAAYDWEGKKTGKGRMEITDTSAPSRVIMRLEFIKPFAAVNTAEFTVNGRNGASEVTWAMTGHKSFMPKLMGLFFSMDKMVGGSFAAGLADLKAKVEG
jgi:hypothetical protein